jgi:hypothetical protein
MSEKTLAGNIHRSVFGDKSKIQNNIFLPQKKLSNAIANKYNYT